MLKREKEANINKWVVLFVISIWGIVFFSQPLAMAKDDTYPSRPIAIINPFRPGGGTDIELRNIVPVVQRILGQPIIIVSKPGGATMIGTSYAAGAKPDGYTLFCGGLTTGIITQEFHNADYKLQDFAHIYGWFKGPMDFIVKYDSPFNTFADLIAEGRKRTLKAAAVGIGDFGHLLMVLVEKRTGIRVQQIPYGGGAPSTAAVIKGEVDLSTGLSTTSVRFVKAKQIRALCMLGPRFESLPDVPSINELGYEDFPYLPFDRGVHAPPKTPRDRVEILEAAFKKAVDDPEFRTRMKKQGRPVVHITSQELGQRAQELLKLTDKYIPMMREAAKKKKK